jgi:glucose-1-phosphate thymidylyltransferase
MGHIKKGIILAGGSGSRLYPLTAVVTKQLQPVYDKPMIYYPLTVLLEQGISEICLISKADQLPLFQLVLGDGSKFGITIEYRAQPKPEGIAQAFLIAESFLAGQPVVLALGDNIFHDASAFASAFATFESGATIFAYHVINPGQYGVVEFDRDGNAVYLYDGSVVDMVRSLKPSRRGELEITDLNLLYLKQKKLKVARLPRGFAWLDAGTSSSLHEASSFVQTLEKRQGIKIGCPEEAAYHAGLISEKRLSELVSAMPVCEYQDYLKKFLSEICSVPSS